MIQWTVTAAEMDCSDAIDGGGSGFVNLCGFHDGCQLTTPHPSALILDAKFCAGTNLHTQDRSKDLNALVRHVLIGAICHVLLFGTNLHTQES